MARPKLKAVFARGRGESGELTAIVTVGEEQAKLLSEKLGREVKPGDQFDLGTIAVFERNRWKRFWKTLKIRNNIFN